MSKKILSFLVSFFAVTLIIAMASVSSAYFILRHNLMEKLEGQERASVLIAEQIKSANLNSILAFTDRYYIFIVHQRDGRILFESARRSGDALDLWEENKDALIKELLALRNGELRYPQRKPWQFLLPLNNVRYVDLPDLEWVVATELPAAVTWKQLLKAYSPVVAGGILGFCLLLAGYLSFFSRKEKVVPFAQEFEQPAPKTHPVHSPEYTQRLVSAAQKILESEADQTPPLPPEPAAVIIESAPVVQETEKEQRMIEEVEIKDHIKGAAEKVYQEVQPAAQPQAETEKKEEQPSAEETKKPSEIYFERIMSGAKQKKEKPKPGSIIGMALSKKKNREDVDG